MLRGQFFPQGKFGVIRGFGFNISNAVAYSVDMGVHTDGGYLETLPSP